MAGFRPSGASSKIDVDIISDSTKQKIPREVYRVLHRTEQSVEVVALSPVSSASALVNDVVFCFKLLPPFISFVSAPPYPLVSTLPPPLSLGQYTLLSLGQYLPPPPIPFFNEETPLLFLLSLVQEKFNQ